MARFYEQLEGSPRPVDGAVEAHEEIARGDSECAAQRADAQLSLAEWTRQNPAARSLRRYQKMEAACLPAGVLALALGVLLDISCWQINKTLFWCLSVSAAGILFVVTCLLHRSWQACNGSTAPPVPRKYDVQTLGDLLDRSLTDFVHRAEISEQLTAILPGLKADDAPYIANRHFEILNGYLHRVATRAWKVSPGAGVWGTSYLCAVLDAYVVIGDGRALADVRCIATGKAASGVRDTRCLDAARKCLPYLEKAAAELSERASLLRGAQFLPKEDELLRAAHSAEQTTEYQLVRAFDGRQPKAAFEIGEHTAAGGLR